MIHRRTYRARLAAVFMAMMYFSENQQRAKVDRAKSRGNQMQGSKSPFLVESQRVHVIPSTTNMATFVKCLPGKLISDSVPRIFIES